MASNILTATITADGSKFTKTLGDLSSQLKRFEAGLKTAGSVDSFNRINRAIDATKARMASLSGVQKNFTTSTNSASYSLTNLGRVVQDMPYGFIGIANNLNPLIEGFGRLKTETGSTSSAFKSMLKALRGPAGIGIAVSVVSSLLVVFGDKLFGASKAAKEANEANEKLASSISGDIVKLTSLVAISTNVSRSMQERQKAIDAINQEYGSYLGNLDKEKVSLKNIETSYENIIDSLLRQAVLKGLQDEIEKKVADTAKLIIAAQKVEEKRLLSTQKSTKANLENANSIKIIGRATSDGFIAQQRSLQLLNANIKTNTSFDGVMKRLKDNLKNDLSEVFGIMKNFSIDDLKINVTPEKLNENNKDVVDELQKYLDSLPKLLKPISLNPTVNIEGFRGVLMDKEIKTFAEQFNDKLSNDIQKLIKPPKFYFTPEVQARLDTSFKFRGFEGLTEAQSELAKIGETIATTITPAFDAMVQAIARGENAFKAFGQGVVQILISVIQKLIQTAILAAVLSALFPGGLGGAKGFGAIFGNLLGFGGGRAAGGPVTPGKGYLVGENGPEWFQPNNAGRIVNNSSLAMGSGVQANIGGQFTFRINGYDLIATLNRNQLRQGRLQ